MLLTPEFTPRLEQAIQTFEKNTDAELVVVVANRSAEYPNATWALASIFALVAFSVFMFADYEFFDDHIYFGTLLAFLLGAALGKFIPFLHKLFSLAKTRQDAVEQAAYAHFAREGLHHTKNEVAVLLYLSELEKVGVLIVDRGVKNLLPSKELENLKAETSTLLSANNPQEALLKWVKKNAEVFASAMPALSENEDELGNITRQKFKNHPRNLRVGFGAKSFKL